MASESVCFVVNEAIEIDYNDRRPSNGGSSSKTIANGNSSDNTSYHPECTIIHSISSVDKNLVDTVVIVRMNTSPFLKTTTRMNARRECLSLPRTRRSRRHVSRSPCPPTSSNRRRGRSRPINEVRKPEEGGATSNCNAGSSFILVGATCNFPTN
mmetsp:Transcript_25790/g.36940  ORF Transcript_25790/g.36940 Transcript_25790/m.36940 type:complete len:155 (-) Transcript_25790:130-594(-)